MTDLAPPSTPAMDAARAAFNLRTKGAEHRRLLIRNPEDGEALDVTLKTENRSETAEKNEIAVLHHLKALRRRGSAPELEVLYRGPLPVRLVGEAAGILAAVPALQANHQPGVTCEPHIATLLECFAESAKKNPDVAADNVGCLLTPLFADHAAENLQPVMNALHRKLRSRKFSVALAAYTRKQKRTEHALRAMFRRCLAKVGCVCISRIDLQYAVRGSEGGERALLHMEDRDDVSPEIVKQDRDAYLEAVRRLANSAPHAGHLLAHAWKIEFGTKKGWHLHCIVLYDGRRVTNGWFRGNTLGKLWEKVTAGRGTYEVCRPNDRSAASHALGIAMRGDADAEAAFNELAAYVALDELMPPANPPMHSQSFGINYFGGFQRITHCDEIAHNPQGDEHEKF